MRVLRWFGLFLLAIAAVAGITAAVARSSDGPIGLFAGGPLVSGELASGPDPDWSFVREIPEIEFQLETPPRSRTVWILEHNGDIYIPCGMTNLRFWKKWPYEALEDGRTVLRIDGTRYERQAVLVDDDGLRDALATRAREKYQVPEAYSSGSNENLWFFRMDPRS